MSLDEAWETTGWCPPEVDWSQPSAARIYDYWLGGKNSFPADREVAERVAELAPWVLEGVRANREFLRCAVTYMARAGVNQFIDIGSGLPTPPNVHQIAELIDGQARVVYVDNDPVVLAHARALLADRQHIRVVAGDARRPEEIMEDPQIRDYIDWTQPVGLLFVAVLHFVAEDENPAGIIRFFRDAMAPRSFIAVSHVTDGENEQRANDTRKAAELYGNLAVPFTVRSATQIEALFEGFELVPPGLVPANRWSDGRANISEEQDPSILAGVGRLRRQ